MYQKNWPILRDTEVPNDKKEKKIKMADLLGLNVKNTKNLKFTASLYHTSNLILKVKNPNVFSKSQ